MKLAHHYLPLPTITAPAHHYRPCPPILPLTPILFRFFFFFFSFFLFIFFFLFFFFFFLFSLFSFVFSSFFSFSFVFFLVLVLVLILLLLFLLYSFFFFVFLLNSFSSCIHSCFPLWTNDPSPPFLHHHLCPRLGVKNWNRWIDPSLANLARSILLLTLPHFV